MSKTNQLGFFFQQEEVKLNFESIRKQTFPHHTPTQKFSNKLVLVQSSEYVMPIRLKALQEPFYEEAISSLNSSSQKFILLRLEEQAT